MTADVISSYRILCVCTGNICRSPTMERLLVARLTERLGPADAGRFVVGSAGTWGLVGEPMAGPAAACLKDLGGDPAGFVARKLSVELIDAADLILTATREHRATVVTMRPQTAIRTLTWREWSRLLEPVTPADVADPDPVERMHKLSVAAVGGRGRVPLKQRREDDLTDPYGAPMEVYRAVAQQIDVALKVPLDLLSAP